jgi:hypothetical protein
MEFDYMTHELVSFPYLLIPRIRSAQTQLIPSPRDDSPLGLRLLAEQRFLFITNTI